MVLKLCSDVAIWRPFLIYANSSKTVLNDNMKSEMYSTAFQKPENVLPAIFGQLVQRLTVGLTIRRPFSIYAN
jgi:hypothetical protein